MLNVVEAPWHSVRVIVAMDTLQSLQPKSPPAAQHDRGEMLVTQLSALLPGEAAVPVRCTSFLLVHAAAIEKGGVLTCPTCSEMVRITTTTLFPILWSRSSRGGDLERGDCCPAAAPMLPRRPSIVPMPACGYAETVQGGDTEDFLH